MAPRQQSSQIQWPPAGAISTARTGWGASLSDPARIRTAMGGPLSKAEIDAHMPFVVDMFLRGCGHKGR